MFVGSHGNAAHLEERTMGGGGGGGGLCPFNLMDAKLVFSLCLMFSCLGEQLESEGAWLEGA